MSDYCAPKHIASSDPTDWFSSSSAQLQRGVGVPGGGGKDRRLGGWGVGVGVPETVGLGEDWVEGVERTIKHSTRQSVLEFFPQVIAGRGWVP